MRGGFIKTKLQDFSQKYLHFLQTELEGLNLTAIQDEKDFYVKQILDSVCPYYQSEKFKSLLQEKGTLIDIGFGGGFPLIPLAYLCPEINFIGIEARMKKVEGVEKIREFFGLKNVKLIHARYDDLLLDIPSVVTFKAVGMVVDILNVMNCYKDQWVYFYKGPQFDEKEVKGLSKIKKYWEFLERDQINLIDPETGVEPDPSIKERILIGFKCANVPRGTGKKLVKLSQFL
ncbi:MAG: class I SAM-dependent methyltransferase [Bacteriovoracaceae bacterium]|nr:class I SAM-dependent methyltransferase [Bacteriovoracaceae bacterium]